jgi:protein-disulfide isomerase
MKVKSRARQARDKAQANRSRRNRLMLVSAAIAVCSVVALILVGNALRPGSDSVTHASQAQGRILGSPTAAVTIEVWEDFQCPVCKAANGSVLSEIEKNYVTTGKANLAFRNFPFLGDESFRAAEAAECAAEQDDFWPYHDALFAAQRAENSGTFTTGKLKSIAGQVGLDQGAFAGCLDSGRYKNAVQDEKSAGLRQGVNATPTIFVNGTRVADWRSYDGFAALIEKTSGAQ